MALRQKESSQVQGEGELLPLLSLFLLHNSHIKVQAGRLKRKLSDRFMECALRALGYCARELVNGLFIEE